MLDILKVETAGKDASQEFKVSQRRQSSTSSMKANKLSSVVPLATSNRQVSSIIQSPREEDSNDEMIEVTPEVQMFIGNHFMSDMINGSGGGEKTDQKSGETQDESSTTLRLKKASNLLMADMNDSDNSMNRNGLHSASDDNDKASFLCRLCGRSAPSSAALFAHLLYPHYAHLWRTEIPHRANQYLCKQCPYSTTKRQHFVQHVAKVHEDLKKKLQALGENIEILDNLNPSNGKAHSTERIISKVAKFKTSDDLSYDENMAMSASEYSNVNSPMNNEASEAAIVSTPKESSKSKLELSSFGLIPGRFPRGYKPFVKCRLCGKGWKGKDNFFTHLVSTHFKHMWSAEVPKHADMFHCHVGNCQYQSKYRYNFLFHLAGKHKQLKEKLAKDGISLDVLVPIEVDEVDDEMLAGGSPTILKTQSLAMQQHFLNNETNMQKFLAATAPPPNSGGGGRTPSHGKYSAANSTVRLICRVCKKISFNHTCHRQHVVSKHFQDFWADKTPDGTGLFHCHHCDYQTPNRSVFVIHLAYTHSELKTKLKEAGNNPDFADPDVYGKRKYRRSHYDNTQHLVHSITGNNPGLTVTTSKAPSAPKMAKLEPIETDEDAMPAPTSSVLPKMSAASTSSGSHDDSEKEDMKTNEKVKYVCRLCKTEFNKQKAIVEHLALAHFYQVWEDDRPENGSFYVPPEGPFVCQHCPFTSSARAPFIAHFVNQHEALKSVMSLQYGDKTVEDLYSISGNADDETYDEGDDDEDELDDDEENAPDEDDMEDMDDEMDGQASDMEFHHNLPVDGLAEEASSGW